VAEQRPKPGAKPNAASDDAPPSLASLRAELDAAEARIQFLRQHNPLTGLPNRDSFLRRAGEQIERASQQGQALALLFVDIDHYKRVNESLGHEAGDAVLRTLAQRITEVLRVTDNVGHFAGDQFLVLLGGNPEEAAILEVSRKLLQAIEAPLSLGPQRRISVTASVGVALYPLHSQQAGTLLRQADTAATQAKRRGRAQALWFQPEMGAAAYDALVLESDLGRALAEGQFELAFQPQVRWGDGVLVGMEALVRWRHPQRGWVSPDDFIPVAEQRRLMLGIGQWVFSEALRCWRLWRDQAGVAARVGVNLSAMQFQGRGFVEWVRQALDDSGVSGEALELEVTERMIMDDLPDAQASLQALRSLGVHVALDDFGTGTTSLSQLKHLGVDRLKIDRSFVQDLPGDAASAAVAKAIISLGQGLGLQVLAEGVETEAQWAWLAEQGCLMAQGHWIAQPMNAADFGRWLQARA
jgi:diguanylate cyclase (GGDEF)-like protein